MLFKLSTALEPLIFKFRPRQLSPCLCLILQTWIIHSLNISQRKPFLIIILNQTKILDIDFLLLVLTTKTSFQDKQTNIQLLSSWPFFLYVVYFFYDFCV